MPELQFVNKAHNNSFFEWGRNCATLGYGEVQTSEILEDWGRTFSQEDLDMFWEGYNDGPRESKEVYSIAGICEQRQ